MAIKCKELHIALSIAAFENKYAVSTYSVKHGVQNSMEMQLKKIKSIKMKTSSYYFKKGLQHHHVNIFSNQASSSQQFCDLEEQEKAPVIKLVEDEIKENNPGFITRISPFLLFAVFLMGFFPYLMITGKGPVESTLMLVLLFPFTVGNIFYFDWVLWNSFKGKRLLNIWLIELTLALAVYLVIANL